MKSKVLRMAPQFSHYLALPPHPPVSSFIASHQEPHGFAILYVFPNILLPLPLLFLPLEVGALTLTELS